MGFSHGFQWTPEKTAELRRMRVEEGLTLEDISKRMGLTLSQIQKASQRLKPRVAGGAPVVPSGVIPAAGKITLQQIRDRFDMKAAIYRTLSDLARGELIVETDLRQVVAASSVSERARFTRTVEESEEEFRPFRIRMKFRRDGEERWYWGHKDDVAAACSLRDS